MKKPGPSHLLPIRKGIDVLRRFEVMGCFPVPSQRGEKEPVSPRGRSVKSQSLSAEKVLLRVFPIPLQSLRASQARVRFDHLRIQFDRAQGSFLRSGHQGRRWTGSAQGYLAFLSPTILFDGGKRIAEIKDSRTLLSEAELNLTKIEEEVAVQVETAYDKVEQLQDLSGVAAEALKAREEASRVTDRQFEQNAALASAKAEAHAKALSAQASYLDATLGLSLAQGDLKRTIGELPR